MKTFSISKKVTLIVFSTITLMYSGNLNAQGPNAPEAASFEPVDATDMVNLVTGDLSYVLPLLNIPSPEGGYPVALSYHAGIPLDLEASWVGLGWNINPGAINRNVNGFPDDWGTSLSNDFFYDAGWTETYYDFGIGANIYGINVGLGAYWGSNKTFGGSVSFGIGNLSANIEAGTRGIGIGGQLGLLSANISTNGVGLGVSLNNSYGGGGINLNYGFDSGISSTASVKMSGATGISLNSNHGISGSIGGLGGGLSQSSSTVSAGDYAVTFETKGIDLDLMLFRIRANRTRVKYDLFKETEDVVTGILYPYETLKDQFGNYIYNKDIPGNMDVVSDIAYDETVSPASLINQKEQAELTHLLYPAFDNYSLTAQGISGSIRPEFNELIKLSTVEKNGINNVDKEFKLNGSVNNTNILNQQNLDINLNNGMQFYFKNTQTSFLRTNISSLSFGGGGSIEDIFNNTQAIESSIYTSNFSPSGEQIVNSIGKKRDGKFIETFTNSDINIDNTNGWFIEAKNINRSNNNLFPSIGIGGFRVTALDGKVYHYSLPVYNFELYYRNFHEETNEDDNFFLNSKEEQFATHWLLTAITGPDFVDSNSNGELDQNDYGYWVEFEYGKWTDGYIWKGATGDYDVVTGSGGSPDTYEYYRGRKQIYYLDAIKTRTHTAYFVKSSRKDSKGEEYKYYDSKITSTTYDILNHSKSFVGNKRSFIPITYSDNLPTQINNASGSGEVGEVSSHHGFYSRYFYADFPKHDVLKLDKIILISNSMLLENNLDVNKSYGQPLNNSNTAYFYNNGSVRIENSAYRTDNFNSCTPGNNSVCFEEEYNDQVFYKENDFTLKEIDIHLSDNVLDINDIVNSDIELYAQKIIEFDYNYKLASNSYNSDAPNQGKLTLNSFTSKGKGGVQILPPHTFNYENSFYAFDEDQEDAWGYNTNNSDSWSLNEIKTPLGSKIQIQYESDDFYTQAVTQSNTLFTNKLKFSFITPPPIGGADAQSAPKGITRIKIEVDDQDPAANGLILSDYFDPNKLMFIDMWYSACFNHRGSGYDRSTVDIESEWANIIELNTAQNYMIIDVSGSSPYFRDVFQSSAEPVSARHAGGDYGGVENQNKSRYDLAWTPESDWRKYSMKHVVMANKIIPNKKEGGIRVKSIEVSDELSTYTTNYYYNLKGYDKSQNSSNYRSSGITSYSPSKEARSVPYVAELPQPTVMYKNVTVENSNSVTRYEFETLEPYENSSSSVYSLGDSFSVTKDIETVTNPTLNRSKYTIHNRLNNLGRLKSKHIYNLQNQILSKDVYNYKSNLDTHGEGGVHEESYMSKSINSAGYGSQPNYFINVASRINYPSVLENIEASQGSYTNTHNFNKNDFLTGQVLETITEDSKGNRFKTETVPAYTIPEYGLGSYSMGSKVDNITNKNMLSQEAMTKTYIDDSGTWKETGVGISTWNNEWIYPTPSVTSETVTNPLQKIWRKHKSFIWDGETNEDGTYLDFTGDDDNFDWTVGSIGNNAFGQPVLNETTQANLKWKNISTTTLYDHYSMPLEQRDINNNYSITKMTDNNTKIALSVNSQYYESCYTGAEYYVTGANRLDAQVNGYAWLRKTAFAHTGDYSLAITPSDNSFGGVLKKGQHKVGTYKISAWIHKNNYVNAKVKIGTSGALTDFNGEVNFAGDWVLMNHYYNRTNNAGDIMFMIASANGTIYVDDFRIHPIASTMTSYVYNEWDELVSILGGNNLATKFEYDSQGRLTKTYQEVIDAPGVTGGFKLVKENDYNYRLQQ